MNTLSRLAGFAALAAALLCAPAAVARGIPTAEMRIDGGPAQPMTAGVTDTNRPAYLEQDFSFSLPTAGLSLGSHWVEVRVQDDAGVWSAWRGQWIRLLGEQHLVAAEYFFDTDPGAGQGTPIPAPRDGTWNAAEEAIRHTGVVDTLPNGRHTLFLRAKDSEGRWGLASQVVIEVTSPITLTNAEWTTDPLAAPGAGHPMTPVDGAWDGTIEEFTASPTTDELGMDCTTFNLHVRVQDSLGRWSTRAGLLWDDGKGEWVFDPVLGWAGAKTGTMEVVCDTGALEADLDGTNGVTVVDWVGVGRLVAGLDPADKPSTFIRADCAPRETVGNGLLSVADWTQAGRYAAGLDVAPPSGGPLALAAARPSRPVAVASVLTRRLQAGMFSAVAPGQTVEVPVVLHASGDENAVGFSLRWDPARLTFAGVTPGAAGAGLTLQVNDREAAVGRLGLALARSVGGAILPGERELLRVRFAAHEGSGTTAVTFADQPVLREVASPEAAILPANFQDGVVTVIEQPRWRGLVAQPGGGLVLEFAAEAGLAWEIQVSEDLVRWETAARVTSDEGGVRWSDPAAGQGGQRFYRAVSR